MLRNKSQEKATTEVLLKEEKIYKPSREVIKKANVKDYKKVIREAQKNPEKFWQEAARELEWFKPFEKVLDRSKAPFFKWFKGGRCNIVHNALDRYIGTSQENKLAIIYQNEDGQERKLTYQELSKEVNKLANGLKKIGIKRGDRIAIYLPNIPEATISMLASAKIGAIHSLIYAGFSAGALSERIKDCQAKVLITCDISSRRGKIIKLGEITMEALKNTPSVKKVIMVRRQTSRVDKGPRTLGSRGKYISYQDLIAKESERSKTEIMQATDPLFILYTSGTTAKPKGVVHVHGGYMVGVLKTIKWVFDLTQDDIYWCAADVGWVTGHSYIVYGPLMAGVTTLMYEGVPDYPQPDRVWKIIEKYKVNIFYTSPTAIRALMRYGDSWPQKHNLSSLRLLGSVGEPINPETWRWYWEKIGQKKCPIMDTWWQTESGMIMISPLPVTSLKAGSVTRPFPGIEAQIVDKNGKEVSQNKGGFLVIKNPWPAMLSTLYKNPKRYLKTYWSHPSQGKKGKYYLSGDVACKDKDGYFWIQGRADDVLKIAGHRIGTAEIESALVGHEGVVEAGVIGKPDPLRGEVAKAFVILKKGCEGSRELIEELKQQVRKTLGPIAIVTEIEFVTSLPKTRSGKIMRRVLKAQELGLPLGDITTLAE